MRELRRVCCAVLLMSAGVMTAGCRSAGPRAAQAPATIDVHVNNDCSLADPGQEMVHLDYTPPSSGPFNAQVRWIVDKGPEDTAVITAKPAEYQDPADRARGKQIRDLLNGTFVIAPGSQEKRSGLARSRPPFQGDKSVVWVYSIDIVHAVGDPCHLDPGLCYRTADGAWICSR